MRLDFKAFRIKHGYTQEQLAEALGVSQQTISSWESKMQEPRLMNIKKMAELFNTDIGEIFSLFNTTKVVKNEEKIQQKC